MRRFFSDPDRVIILLVALALVERVVMFFHIGAGAVGGSDDVAYIRGGIVFANTGVLSVWSDYPTAKIMPGMPVLCGVFSLIFGEGDAYVNALRCCMIAFGCASVYVFYKCCAVVLPKWYGIFAAAAFLLPNWAWSDNNILTEAPYLLFYLLTFYYTLRLGEEDVPARRDVAGYVISFMLALMFRPNILTMPLFTAAYLLLFKKRRAKAFVRPALVLMCALLMFVVPWSVRNYRIFHQFIPVTNGAANPTLLGTYQGKTAPADEDLDYETNVYSVIREEYSEYYNDDGTLRDLSAGEMISEATDKLKAQYRLREWWKRDPKGLIWSYLVSKPACMINWVWCWLPNPPLYYTLHYISCVNFACCILSVILAFAAKRERRITLFLALIYWINLYVFAFSFASERYSAMLMPFRYMLCAVGLHVAVELIRERRAKKYPAHA